MSVRQRQALLRIVIPAVTSIVVTLLLIHYGFPHVGSIVSSYDPPPPPDWLNRLAQEFMAKVAPTLYWAMAFVLFAAYEIMRWQRANDESPAAIWFRRLQLSKACLWLTLAVGRTLLQEWLLIGFAVVIVYIASMLALTALSFIRTYIIPTIRCRGGRCEPIRRDLGPLTPRPWIVERDGERRKKERRKHWPPTRERSRT